MRQLLCIALVGTLCQGCFVFDELDKGEEIMRQHRPKNIDEVEAEPAPTTRPKRKDDAGMLAFAKGLPGRALGWWEELQEPDPEDRPVDEVVRCELPERIQFTRKSDCIVRGGRVL